MKTESFYIDKQLSKEDLLKFIIIVCRAYPSTVTYTIDSYEAIVTGTDQALTHLEHMIKVHKEFPTN